MSITTSAILLAILGIAAGAADAAGQSRQPWSAQGSVLYTAQDLGGSAGVVGGIGFEAQARRTFARWSLGGGVQYSRHTSGPDALGLTGVFVEPRFVPGGTIGPFAPYLAGRVAYLRGTLSSDLVDGSGSAGGWAVGAGAGLIFRLSRRVNIDVGAAVLRQTLGNITLDDVNQTEVALPAFLGFVIKAGFSFGFESASAGATRLLHR